jgi:hypothetical protein
MSNPNLAMIAQMETKALRAILELDFNKAIVAYAQSQGFLVHYERRSGHVGKDGQWRGSGPKGKPDLTLARGGVVLLAELKRETGKPSPEQLEWLEALGEHGRLWKPRDAGAIMETLKEE